MPSSKPTPLVFPPPPNGAGNGHDAVRARKSAPVDQMAPARAPSPRPARPPAAEPSPPQAQTAPVPSSADTRPLALSAPKVEREAESPATVAALWASLLWALGFAAFALAYHQPDGPFHLGLYGYALLAVVAAAPLGLIWAAAFALKQARLLIDETERARRNAEGLVGPAVLAAARAGQLIDQVRAQVAATSEAAAAASERLAALQEALGREAERLSHATAAAEASSGALVDRLAGQRAELNTLAVTLDARAVAVTDAINRQTQMVAEASDLAEAQLREAEASLAARSAELASTAEQATELSRIASDDLARQVGRLETAGVGVGEQLRSVEDGLGQQRAAIVTVAHALRADHEEFVALAETRTARLSEFLTGASRDVTALNEAASLGAQSMAQLVEAAAGKFTELAAAAQTARDEFTKSAAHSFDALAEVGAKERGALEAQMRQTLEALSTAAAQAREAASAHAQAARSQVDQLHETAFAAGQKADQVFEARLGEARGLIEQSSRLVEQASAATAAKLEEGVAQARRALEELGAMVADVRSVAADLPAETQTRVGEVRAAIEKGMSDLAEMAKRTARETQAIDAAFQDRVRRNYEMLSEAVQLMGVVAHGGQTAIKREASAPRPSSDRVPAASPPKALPKTAPAPPIEEAASASPSTPRPKIKFTDVAAVPPASPESSPIAAAEKGEWSWKSLLTSIGGRPEPSVDGGPELCALITEMGIDPTALISHRRVEEIAVAIFAGDVDGGREVVRNLAPAAVRRLTRRLMSDAEFKDGADVFVHGFATLLEEAKKRNPQPAEATGLLASDQGRAFLLLDAAGAARRA